MTQDLRFSLSNQVGDHEIIILDMRSHEILISSTVHHIIFPIGCFFPANLQKIAGVAGNHGLQHHPFIDDFPIKTH